MLFYSYLGILVNKYLLCVKDKYLQTDMGIIMCKR